MTALESQMPKVAYADLGDINMAYYEVGPRVGIPVILCHGWPELAFSWRPPAARVRGRRTLGDCPRHAGLRPDRGTGRRRGL